MIAVAYVTDACLVLENVWCRLVKQCFIGIALTMIEYRNHYMQKQE